MGESPPADRASADRASIDRAQSPAIQVNQDLLCSKCMISGAATWEEPPPALHARARNRMRKLVGLTAGFKSVDKGGREGPVIACGGCGARISG